MLIKALTLPLTTAQLESTTKMQKLAPLQQKIQAKYANDEATKNQVRLECLIIHIISSAIGLPVRRN